ncbi:flagellar hook-basal body complex protein [Paraburkholderia sp. J10-1]|uniref:flagellar hook protein FlgE n=1 Tax=Paraburkholderia sp. J10-1 TaxID=2805430 RepID=UPI002AB7B3AA|nr:flagellar hook-basal body complex protein [Paraburkholderia sp. J10-1]
MLNSIYIGMSGLTAYSKGLQTISNNVANMNTPGFKGSTPRFEDTYYGQQFAGSTPGTPASMQFGSGVQYGYASLNMAQGDLRSSSGQLDLAIQGNGFLTLLDGDATRYVRTGQFTIGQDGFIEDKVTGLRLAALTDSGKTVPVSMTGLQSSAPKATTAVTFSDNLSTGSTDFSIPDIDVYDANGGKHTLKVAFEPDSDVIPGRWKVTVTDENGLPVTEGPFQFNGGIPEPGADTVDFTLTSTSAPPLSLKLDFSNVTSFSAGSSSTMRVASKDGYAFGTVTSMSVNADGKIEIAYSNGQKALTDVVAIASFRNPGLLTQAGNGIFDASTAGPPNWCISDHDGAGTLVSGSTESSNVDLSSEFGQLILIQRGFQASSQVVSTANEMIMQLFQMRGQG